jgi:hypothetical protein
MMPLFSYQVKRINIGGVIGILAVNPTKEIKVRFEGIFTGRGCPFLPTIPNLSRC